MATRIWVSKVVASGLIAVLVASCGRKDKKDDSGDSTTTTTSAGGSGGTTISVSSLNGLPSMEDLLKTSSASLDLAVVGTPPAFTSITSDTIETYLTPAISTLVSDISTASQSHDWTTVKTLGQSFRDGESKCLVMEDAARQLSMLAETTSSSCYMSHVDSASSSLLKKVSGDDVAAGQFFAAGDSDIVRQIFMGKYNMMIQIQSKTKEAGIFQVKLTSCSLANKAQSASLIRVDQTAGTLTYQGALSASTALSSTTNLDQAVHFKVTGGLTAASDGSLTFDPSKQRNASLENKQTVGTTATMQYMASMNISSDTMTTKFAGTSAITQSDASVNTWVHKGGSSVRFTGTKASDAVIYEGAGTAQGSFQAGTQSAFPHTDTIGFEFNSGDAPEYTTVTSSTYLDTVNAFDFTTDKILSASYSDPDVTLIDDADCALTPTSVYSFTDGASMLAVHTACDTHFTHADEICSTLQQDEGTIFAALKAAGVTK